MPEYDIMCRDCSMCIIDPKHPDNSVKDRPKRGVCTHYQDGAGNPLACDMAVSFNQCPGAKRGTPQIMGEMPEKGPPNSDETREDKIARLKRELDEAENYEPDPPPSGAKTSGLYPEKNLEAEREKLKKEIDALNKKRAAFKGKTTKKRTKTKKKTGQKKKKAVKKK